MENNICGYQGYFRNSRGYLGYIFLGKGGRGSGHLSKYGGWGIVDMADHESAHTPTYLPEYIFLLQLYLQSPLYIVLFYSSFTLDIFEISVCHCNMNKNLQYIEIFICSKCTFVIF